MSAPPLHRYRTLDPEQIIGTIDRLQRRIQERFPGSGLSQVCEQLRLVGQQAEQRARWIARPIIAFRLGLLLLFLLLVALVVYHLPRLPDLQGVPAPVRAMEINEWIQTLEAGTNELVVLGAGAFFVVTLERRIKRGRALEAIHELRSLAHIVDMHQLTKDPERLFQRWIVTESSPRQSMTPFELERYLDYCSEMLSLVAKVAALYVQRFDDSVALSAVNEVELLTNGLSSKIWQKIMILRVVMNQEGAPAVKKIVTQ